MHSCLHKHEGLINCRSPRPLHLHDTRPAKDLLALLQECLLLYFSSLVPLCRVRWAGQVSTSWLVGQGGAPAAVARKSWGPLPPKVCRGDPARAPGRRLSAPQVDRIGIAAGTQAGMRQSLTEHASECCNCRQASGRPY